MARIFLQATCTPTNQSAFTRTEYYFNTETRAEEKQTSNTLACQVYALAVGAIIDSWCDLNGDQTTVYYKAGASYNPTDGLTGRTVVANSPSCPIPTTFTLGRPNISNATGPTTADGSIGVPFFTPTLAAVGVLAGQTVAQPAVNGFGYLEFTGLNPGRYDLVAEDVAGTQATLPGLVVSLPGGDVVVPIFWIVTQNLDQSNDFTGFYTTSGAVWSVLRKRVEQVVNAQDSNPPVIPAGPNAYGLYYKPLGEVVDAYFLPGGAVYRRVYPRDDDGDGQNDGDVRFVDTVITTAPTITGLQLDNLIIQHLHRAATSTAETFGSVLLEAHSSTPGPLAFVRVATGEENTTGQFGSLPAGPHLFRVTDAGGNTLETTVVIEDRYQPRWFVDSKAPDGTPVRVDILGRDYLGAPTELVGAGRDCLERSWATAGQDVEGVLPEAQGQGCRLSVYQQFADQFADMFVGPHADDRAFRFDVHVGGVLVFRGYHLPDLYDQDLSVEVGGVITFTAGDGLGALRNTVFLNHDARPLAGRWPLLNTVLHCLSRCECGPLPLYVQTDLREASQAANTDWLPTFHTDRAGYAATTAAARPWTCRAVIEAALRPAHAVLVQRNGAWWIVSANAAGTDAAFFAYHPNGTPQLAPDGVTPLLLKPAGYATGNLFWLEAAQRAQTLAAARAVVASTKLLLVKNQLADGTLQAWQPDLLRPVGWSGTLNVERLELRAPDDAKPTAGTTKLRTGAAQLASAALRSPTIPFRAGVNEAPVRVALRLRPRLTLAPGATAVDVLVQVRVVVNGTPLPTLLHWRVDSQEKEVTVEGFVPFGEGMADGVLCVELLTPTLLPGPQLDTPAVVDIYEVTLQTLPGAVDWPDADEITALNDTGFLVLPEVELHHADTPRLPLGDGTLRPVPTMDAYAWRHVLTYADGTPTVSWRRGTNAAAPLLETAGLDRLDLRRVPVSIFAGPVRGAAVSALGFGAVVDCPQDAPGVRFWAVGATVRDLEGKADVVLREIGLADAEPLPGNRLITEAGTALVTHDGYVLVYA